MKLDIMEIGAEDRDKVAPYFAYSESQLLHIYEPDNGIFIAETGKVILRALDAGYEPLSVLVQANETGTGADPEKMRLFPEVKQVLDQLAELKLEKRAPLPEYLTSAAAERAAAGEDVLPVYCCDRKTLIGITGFNITGGILCAMRRRTEALPGEVCKNARRIAVLENVVNPTNVGAIIRCAAAMGIEAILFSPGCADPLYRRAIRVGMGNVFGLPWAYIGRELEDWKEHGIEMLHDLGFQTVAMALRDDSMTPDDPRFKEVDRLAILLGTEGEGLDERTIANSDYTVKIPMREGVDSLNVAAASAVAFWELAGKYAIPVR